MNGKVSTQTGLPENEGGWSVCACGKVNSAPSLQPTEVWASAGFFLHEKLREGRWGGDAQHREDLCSDSPPLSDKTGKFNRPGEKEREKKIWLGGVGGCAGVWTGAVGGLLRQRIDKNRSTNNGQDPVMHKSNPRAAFDLGQLSVPRVHSPQTSGTSEDKEDGKEY